MHVFELISPGTWLDEPNLPDGERFKVESLLEVLKSHFEEAALALGRFELERTQPWQRPDFGKESEFEKRRAIEAALESRLADANSPEEAWAMREEIRFQADVHVKRERWESGQVPQSYLRRGAFLYAKVFLYALDTIGKTLRVLAGTTGTPATLEAIRQYFYDALPSLTAVRDTAHHMEDRARGVSRRGDPLILQPVANRMVNGGCPAGRRTW
ncbi:MAG: hypothetical protein AB1673_17385 [Actinomycetota bacterium]